jgi:hypothetical protein
LDNNNNSAMDTKEDFINEWERRTTLFGGMAYDKRLTSDIARMIGKKLCSKSALRSSRGNISCESI